MEGKREMGVKMPRIYHVTCSIMYSWFVSSMMQTRARRQYAKRMLTMMDNNIEIRESKCSNLFPTNENITALK